MISNSCCECGQLIVIRDVINLLILMRKSMHYLETISRCDNACSGRVALINGLGGQTGGGGHARSAAGGMDMVVEQVGGRDKEIKRELSGASGLASETKNRALRALFSVWGVKIKVRVTWVLWQVGCMLLLRW